MLDASHIVYLQATATTHWHDASSIEPTPANAWESLILDQHRANFDLWHEEDAARDPFSSDHDITEHKHAIDKLNQRRNDLVEQMDKLLLAEAPSPVEATPLHSETPGMIIDRLSILALKRFHTEEETRRPNASGAHRERNVSRLTILENQLRDLATCLDELWRDILSSRRRFKLYYQLKMYNDPTLNPVLYRYDAVSSPERKGS